MDAPDATARRRLIAATRALGDLRHRAIERIPTPEARRWCVGAEAIIEHCGLAMQAANDAPQPLDCATLAGVALDALASGHAIVDAEADRDDDGR